MSPIRNDKTRRAYRRDVRDFVAFSGSISFEELRSVTRAHVIAWRKDLEAQNKKGSTVRRKLSSLSSLFDYLCDKSAVPGNPVDGVEHPQPTGCSSLDWQTRSNSQVLSCHFPSCLAYFVARYGRTGGYFPGSPPGIYFNQASHGRDRTVPNSRPGSLGT